LIWETGAVVPFVCNSQEVQQIKNALLQDPLNLGVGILHEPTGQIFLAPFDSVPGGHFELVTRFQFALADCKGFAITLLPDGTFVPINNSHLNGIQGQTGILQMPGATFSGIIQALQNAGL
jgi:hypothetical protein